MLTSESRVELIGRLAQDAYTKLSKKRSIPVTIFDVEVVKRPNEHKPHNPPEQNEYSYIPCIMFHKQITAVELTAGTYVRVIGYLEANWVRHGDECMKKILDMRVVVEKVSVLYREERMTTVQAHLVPAKVKV